MTTHDAPVSVHPRGLFGHPQGLMTLFFTEMWERFSYYGMRAILTLFMVAPLAAGGLGFDARTAGSVYALYTSLVYLAAMPGGWLADNLLGQRRSVFLGGVVIMIGHILLAMHGLPFFYGGLACVVVGTGLLKPNISAIVGQLYEPGDVRRDAGFSIFYMGINLGAFISPLVCGWLAQSETFRGMLQGWGISPESSWHWGFGAAAVGMFFGLVQYVATGRSLGRAGLEPPGGVTPERRALARRTLQRGGLLAGLGLAAAVVLALAAPRLMTPENISNVFGVLLLVLVVVFFLRLFRSDDWTDAERKRLRLILALFLGAAVFWGLFEQAGSTLTLFADRSTDNAIFGFVFPSSWWQSVNAVLIIGLAPLFAWFWVILGKRNPSSPAKFAIGLVFAGLGFLVLVGGAMVAGEDGKAGVGWLLTVYLLHTIGELWLSPVGLSSMTKLAPARVVGLMMGVWFLATSVGNFVAGKVASFYEDLELTTLLTVVGFTGIGAGLVMALLVRPIRRMLQGREELLPADSQQ
ncbi:MAG TPA: peptide MFS transporter [Thermoanaerobaculia bacterium]|nr:peptide MFS transporter [Thermoanaerobaculia bacterium]